MDGSSPAAQPQFATLEVSIIVPARDEESSLGACLESLTTQAGVAFEIIVVDDGSSDRTREIAQSFAGVRLISAGHCRSAGQGRIGRGRTALLSPEPNKRGLHGCCLPTRTLSINRDR